MNKKLLFIPILLLAVGCSNQNTTPEVFFDVTIQSSDHGTTTCELSKVKKGGFATFYFTPDSGYEASSIKVNEDTFDVEFDHYTVFNIQKDIVVKTTFDYKTIQVRYFNDDELLFLRNVKAGSDASYFGNTPTKDASAGKTYAFDGWSLTKGGEKVSSFTFMQDTDLYAVFTEIIYSFSMKDSITMKTLQEDDLEIVTDYPESIVRDGLISTDTEVCTVDKNGKVSAVGSGTAKINFVVGGVVIDSCDVTVTDTSNVLTKKCYADGQVIYNKNKSVGKFNACQTLITDSDGNEINQKFVDFSGDFMFDAAISSADNFGLQVHKEIDTSYGSVKKAYQFALMTGNSNNVFLKVNGTIRVTVSYTLSPKTVYNLRIKTSAVPESTNVLVQCFINGEKVIESERYDLDSATNYLGLRYANASTSTNFVTFSNLMVS